MWVGNRVDRDSINNHCNSVGKNSTLISKSLDLQRFFVAFFAHVWYYNGIEGTNEQRSLPMLYFRCVKSVNHGTELVRELKNEFGKKSMLTTIDGNLVVVTEFDSNKMCERLTKLVNGVEYDIMFGQLLPDEAEQCNFNQLSSDCHF